VKRSESHGGKKKGIHLALKSSDRERWRDQKQRCRAGSELTERGERGVSERAVIGREMRAGVRNSIKREGFAVRKTRIEESRPK
jgi:hypothetical protein